MPPIVVAAVIGAAGTAGASAIAAHGASAAAKDQAQVAQEALDFEKQQLAQKQGLLTPYEALGNESGSQLAGLLGLANPEAVGAAMSAARAIGSPSAAATPTVGPKTSFSPNGVGYKPPVGPGAGPSTSFSPNGVGASNLQSLGPGSPNASQTVKMMAPDGTVQSVPVAQVPHYQALGAQVIQ